MEPLMLVLSAVIFRVENGVFEVFQAEHEGSLRIPLAWLSVKPDPPKRGQVLLRVGQAAPPGPVLYGPGASLASFYRGVLIAADDEPQVRALCAHIAGWSGRDVQGA